MEYLIKFCLIIGYTFQKIIFHYYRNINLTIQRLKIFICFISFKGIYNLETVPQTKIFMFYEDFYMYSSDLPLVHS